ncbi:MAG TPA: LamG domain-containing protein [Candidatus Limnocylindrales bacterium]|nr:LamG domain-containing protein [Candidatus Limnocylindrales bacterium]
MYRVNAQAGNSSAYTAFNVRTLNISSIIYGPYNFNESGSSKNTVIPFIVQGKVMDSRTRSGITGAQVNVTILKDGNPHTNRITSTDSGNFVLNFTGDLDSNATGIFDAMVNVNDSGILGSNNTSLTAYSIDQSWADPYRDYRIPILIYNSSELLQGGGLTGSWRFGEGSGYSAADSSGNENTGTLYGNTVVNPGFETLNSSWGNGAESLVFDNARSKNGFYSGKIIKLDAGEKTQFSSNNADNNAGTVLPVTGVQYMYGGCVYIEGGASADIFFFSWNSTNGNRYDGTYDVITATAQNQWVCINGSTTQIAAGDNRLAIRIDNNGGGTIWFDDIQANPVGSWTSGLSGNALQTDGVDDYMGIPNSATLNSNSFTISMWFRADQLRVQGLAHKISAGWTNGWRLFMNSGSGTIEFDAAGEVANIATDSTIAGQWNFVTATYDSNTKIAKIYLNGVLDQQAANVIMQNNYSNSLEIASMENTRFDGTIDTIEYYERALSDEEIAYRYNYNKNPGTGMITFDLALPGGTDPGSLVLYDIEKIIQPSSIIDIGGYTNISFTRTLRPYEGKVLYLYFDRSNPTSPDTSGISSLASPYKVIKGNEQGYSIRITPDKNVYSAGETVVLYSKRLRSPHF